MAKEVKFVPKDCEGDAAPFEGCIVLTAPTYFERLEYTELSGVEFDETGKPAMKGNMIKCLRALVEATKKHYVSVNIKRKSDGLKYETFDDLSVDPACGSMITETAYALLGGMGPSEKR